MLILSTNVRYGNTGSNNSLDALKVEEHQPGINFRSVEPGMGFIIYTVDAIYETYVTPVGDYRNER
jgi:hypothetical protein